MIFRVYTDNPTNFAEILYQKLCHFKVGTNDDRFAKNHGFYEEIPVT